MELRILGPVEARADGRPLALPGTRQRALLALLLLRRGEPASHDALIDDLWGGAPPEGAVKALQVAVSRLRRALGPDGGRVVSAGAGYAFRLEPGELDLERFEQCGTEGRAALAAKELPRAAARLRSALAEWRGAPLADLAYEPFAAIESARLEERRVATLEDRIEADLGLGRHGELTEELETLVARHPLREGLRAQLMVALYRAGRQGDALAAYRDAVRTLDGELGVRPRPELERLQASILAHDPELAFAPPAAEAPRAPPRRATATILVTDRAGEEKGRLRDVLALHAGQEVRASGDGLTVAFESAGAAVACAIDMQRASDRQRVALRVGIATGDVTWEAGECSGVPVSLAQSLSDATAPGQILVGDAVRLIAGAGEAEFEAAGPLEAIGDAWRVRWTARRTVVLPPSPALALDAAIALAGRTGELAKLEAAWAEASAGRRRGVFVAGEPGIGKTRLAAELAARTDGALVLYGHCDDGLAPPAQPFREALAAYVAACPPDELRVQLGGGGPHLLGLLPALAARVPALGEPAPADPDLERLHTLDAVAQLLAAATAVTPALLVLDDLHWADALSWQLLRHVLAATEPMRLLVVGTYRDTEAPRSPLLGEVTTGLARREDIERIDLGPLAEPDVAVILEGAGRAATLAAGVRDATEGNPFFVGEVVRALADDGDPAATITPRVRDVVHWRLSRLPAGTAELLAVAAVAGAEFDVDVVAAAAGLDEDRTLDALEAAETARLVRPAETLDRFAFSHALVRQTILGDVPAGRRVRVHARVAAALETAAIRRAVPASELAVQFAAAGGLVDAADALRYAVAAGDEAAAALAFGLAAEHYEQALAAQSRLPQVADRLDLELARGRALRLAGDARAATVLRQVAAGAEASGDGARMAEALLATGLEIATEFLFADPGMVALLRRALELLPPGANAMRARLLGYLAVETPDDVSEPERQAMAERALALAREAGDPVALASALISFSWTMMAPEDRELRLAIAGELIAGGDGGLPYAVAFGHVFRYIALVEAGDLEAADAALVTAGETARVLSARWTASVWTWTRLLLAGRLADAEAATIRAAELAQAGGFPPSVVAGTLAAGIWSIRVTQGRAHELEAVMRERIDLLPKRPGWTYIYEALVDCELERFERARAAVDLALAQDSIAAPRGLAWSATMVWAAYVSNWVGHEAAAARLYDVLAPFGGIMVASAGPMAGALGRLALTLGRTDEAERHLRDAVALCERMDARAYLAIARRDLGELTGDADLVAAAETAERDLGLERRLGARGPELRRP